MSGIAGILHLDGSPVDGILLARMSEALRLRGPDGSGLHAIGNVGFAHTSLKLVEDAGIHGTDVQPLTLDGRRFIVADARVDARPELAAALLARGQPASVDAADAELILRAYCAWGDDCVAHLLGDFSFAIWDGLEHRLFCARDQLGVKPFYYAQLGKTVVFSNTLECVRIHPAVSPELNDAAIADFLLFGSNQDAGTTTFRDVLRLPPAHSASWSRDETTRRCYWTLPIDEPISFKRADDYTDRFTELVSAAVSDRLRTRNVAVFMSGGMDSPTLAAVAAGQLRRRSGGTVHAMTSVYDRLIPDSERHYAGLVARYLDIPIHFDVRDDETSIADWGRVVVHTPEPVDNPQAFVAGTQFLEKMSTHARVFLYGEGPDNALRYEWRPYLSHLLAGRRVGPLMQALSSDLLMHPRVPLWSLIRQTVGARRQKRRWRQEFPAWLNEAFARACDCRGRWEADQAPSSSRHPIRPLGHGGFVPSRWQPLFEVCDIQGALTATETRHPFLDVRLLRYMLALPAMPWCRNKLVMRRAMKHTLPHAVIKRKKSSLQQSPDFARVKASGLPPLVPAPTLSRYVNAGKVPTAPANVVELRAVLRPLGLNYWLQNLAGR
jgi:asparagine synthase (glutamine-hydrolysing)